MTVSAITLAFALTGLTGFWILIWQHDIQQRFQTEQDAYQQRVATREQPVPYQDRLDHLAEAMFLAYQRDRAVDPLVAETVRAFDMVEDALEGVRG
jgi:hypothetical protein